MQKHVVALCLSLTTVFAGCGNLSTANPSQTPQVSGEAPPFTPETRTTEPGPPTAKTKPRTDVPDALVGTWDGDRAQLSFSPDGYITVTFKKGGSDSGTVVINGSRMTMYLSGGVLTFSRWEISRFDAGYGYEFFQLTLDGTNYVRDVPK
jgi:hypothetical protein